MSQYLYGYSDGVSDPELAAVLEQPRLRPSLIAFADLLRVPILVFDSVTHAIVEIISPRQRLPAPVFVRC